MKKFILSLAAALVAITASAQRASSTSSSFFSTEKADQGVTFGVKAGLNVANFSGDVEDLDSRAAFHAGVTVDIPIVQSIAIQTGLLFSSKGAKFSYEDDEESEELKFKPMYLEIPILASYRYNFNESTQLQVNFGPYFAVGVGGKVKEEYVNKYWGDETEEGELDFFGDEDDEESMGMKRFDAGLQIGAGVTFLKHINVGLAYQFGLANMWREEGSVKNRNFMLSVGYLF